MDPKWKHDCDECVFMGTKSHPSERRASTPNMTYDFYWCEKQGYRTYTSRYGNEAHEYCSYPTHVMDILDPHAQGDFALSVVLYEHSIEMCPAQGVVGRFGLRFDTAEPIVICITSAFTGKREQDLIMTTYAQVNNGYFGREAKETHLQDMASEMDALLKQADEATVRMFSN